MDFLGDAKLRSLQSDGYNVYMSRYFLLKIGNLYSREEEYRRLDLPPDEIFKRRNDAYTNGIVEDLWKEYTIDNLAAERAIRPLTVQRKNSLFFCSTQGALNSATYNTFIETCKQMGISFRDYFRRVMKELQAGRVDYENLLPQTIGLKSTNKYKKSCPKILADALRHLS